MDHIRPLPVELQKVAIEQLNEVPEDIPGDIEALKAWIRQQPHLRARTDDQFLLSFLRGCKYSLEKSKSKLDKFHTLRTKYPQYFRCTDVDAPKFRDIVRLGIVNYLPKPLHDHGQRIAVLRYCAYPAEEYTMEDIFLVLCAMQEIVMLEDDYANVNGITVVMDLDKATAGHLLQTTPSVMKKMTAYSEEAIPLRSKASHFINTPTGFDTIFNFVKPMISEKQQNRLFVHGNKLELMHKQIPQKYLPKEYGGENGSIEEIITYWDKKLDEYRDYFKDNANYGTDEKLRLGKPIDFDTIFGLEGSFRKLNVD